MGAIETHIAEDTVSECYPLKKGAALGAHGFAVWSGKVLWRSRPESGITTPLEVERKQLTATESYFGRESAKAFSLKISFSEK